MGISGRLCLMRLMASTPAQKLGWPFASGRTILVTMTILESLSLIMSCLVYIHSCRREVELIWNKTEGWVNSSMNLLKISRPSLGLLSSQRMQLLVALGISLGDSTSDRWQTVKSKLGLIFRFYTLVISNQVKGSSRSSYQFLKQDILLMGLPERMLIQKRTIGLPGPSGFLALSSQQPLMGNLMAQFIFLDVEVKGLKVSNSPTFPSGSQLTPLYTLHRSPWIFFKCLRRVLVYLYTQDCSTSLPLFLRMLSQVLLRVVLRDSQIFFFQPDCLSKYSRLVVQMKMGSTWDLLRKYYMSMLPSLSWISQSKRLRYFTWSSGIYNSYMVNSLAQVPQSSEGTCLQKTIFSLMKYPTSLTYPSSFNF